MSNEDTTLDGRLAALRSAVEGLAPSPSADRAVAAAIARARRKARFAPVARPWLQRWLLWPVAVAAAIAMVAVVVRAPQDQGSGSVASTQASRRFMPVVPQDEIDRTSEALVVNARMPRMALAQFGLPVNPSRAGDAIDTELLVRPDGAVLAVRFVN